MAEQAGGAPIIGAPPKEKPLKKGPNGECCIDCYFLEEASGDCRAHCPTAQMVPTMTVHPITGRPQSEIVKWSVFPSPNKELVKVIWCGDFKPKVTIKR